MIFISTHDNILYNSFANKAMLTARKIFLNFAQLNFKQKIARIRLRIPPPTVEKLAHQAQVADILTECETPVFIP